MIVSSKELRSSLSHYLKMASQGHDVVVHSSRLGDFRIVPTNDVRVLMSESEFYERIDHSIHQAKEGKVISQQQDESADDFIDRLLCTE